MIIATVVVIVMLVSFYRWMRYLHEKVTGSEKETRDARLEMHTISQAYQRQGDEIHAILTQMSDRLGRLEENKNGKV